MSEQYRTPVIDDLKNRKEKKNMKKLLTIVSLCLAVMMVLPLMTSAAFAYDRDPETGTLVSDDRIIIGLDCTNPDVAAMELYPVYAENYEELAEINAWDDTKDKVPENERAVYEAQIESIRKNIDLNMDSYYGRLNKLSTEFLSIIDKGIQKKLTDEYYDGLYKKKLDFLIRVFLKNK